MRAGGDRSWGSDPVLAGVYFAIVCQNKDDEKKLGRIKVRFPWLDHGDTDQAHWAQIATPMSGNKFGWWMLPDIDDVVANERYDDTVNIPVGAAGSWVVFAVYSNTTTTLAPVHPGREVFAVTNPIFLER